MFSNFWVLFLKIFELVTFVFFSYPVNSFFQWQYVFIRFIFLVEHSFSLLATIKAITEKVSFSCIHGNHCQQNIHSSPSSSLSIQTTLTLKNQSQADRDYLKSFCKGFIFYPTANDQGHNNGVRIQQKLLFRVLLL